MIAKRIDEIKKGLGAILCEMLKQTSDTKIHQALRAKDDPNHFRD
jgi:hypothetical protein